MGAGLGGSKMGLKYLFTSAVLKNLSEFFRERELV